MSPTILNPEIEPTIKRLFQHHKSGQTSSSNAKSNSGHHTDLAELLEVHEPRHVSTISAQLRRVVEVALWTKLGWYGQISSTSQAESKIAPLATDHAGMAIILSTVSSGFVREAAIRSLPSINGPFCFALLLVRLNDWVEEIRTATCERLTQFIEADPVACSELVLSCMDIILDQNRFGRANAQEAQVIERLLAIPTVEDRLRATIMEGKKDLSPRYLRLALRRDRYDYWLPMIISNAAHMRCRVLAINALLKGSIEIAGPCGTSTRDIHLPIDRTVIAIAGLMDTSANVRKSALDYIIDKQLSWEGDETTLLDLIGDRALSVAERAWFLLKARNIDFLESLTQKIGAQPPDIWAVRALGKFGTKNDQNQAYDAAQRCSSRHRIVCLQVAAALEHSAAVSDLKSIASTSPDLAEARRASKALRKLGDRLSYRELVGLISTGVNLNERGLLVFVRDLSPMRIAHVLAMMKIDESDKMYQPLWRLMTLKRNRGAFQPSIEDLTNLSEELRGMPALSNRIAAVLGVRVASAPDA